MRDFLRNSYIGIFAYIIIDDKIVHIVYENDRSYFLLSICRQIISTLCSVSAGYAVDSIRFLSPICWHSMSAGFVIFLTAICWQCLIIQILCTICCLSAHQKLIVGSAQNLSPQILLSKYLRIAFKVWAPPILIKKKKLFFQIPYQGQTTKNKEKCIWWR